MPVPLPEPQRRAELALLERRYDGPIPACERRLAEFGSAAASLLEAAGNAAFYRSLTSRQLATIRQRRAAGRADPALFADFRLYRARWRFWRRRYAALTASPPGQWHTGIPATLRQAPLRAQRGEGGTRDPKVAGG